jgi:hypothetical protein
MIPLWKGKNTIYFGVITFIPFDNLYRRAHISCLAMSWREQITLGWDDVDVCFVLDQHTKLDFMVVAH